MATYSQIKSGSKGDSVTRLQELLKQNGYAVDVDGIFGTQTQQAVRDYQGKNNLSVDGIVGEKTWAALGGGNAAGSSAGKSTADWLADYEGNRPNYQQSQSVRDAADMLAQYEGRKPGPYQSSYADQIQNVLNDILNRKEFNYDFASDPMYQQYAQRAQQQGKMAMMDTMGQAAALTGGYGNTYAQSVGQQTYQGYLQGVNDIIPELRNAAYDMYRDKGNQMLTNAQLLQGLENSEYGKYRDNVGDYYNDLNYAYNKYGDMSRDEYNRYLSDFNAWQADRDYYYGKQQNEQAQSNWQAEYDLAKSQAAKSSGGSSKQKAESTEPEPKINNPHTLDSKGEPNTITVFGFGVLTQENFKRLVQAKQIVEKTFSDGTVSYVKAQ